MNRPRTLRTTTLALASIAMLASFTPVLSAAPVVRTFDNGLKVAVLADPRLPVAHVQLMIPAGNAVESEREHGAARLVAALVTRGTNSRTSAQFSGEIERLGGTITSVASLEYAVLSGVFRAADLEAGLELLSDAAMNPLFDDQEVSTLRTELMRAILQSRRHAGLLAEEHLWAQALPSHPYGIPEFGTLETVAALSREQLQGFHRSCYRPDQAVLVISGGVEVDPAIEAARATFGLWKGKARSAAIPVPPRLPGLTIRLVDLPGAAEAEIRLAVHTPARNTPDALPMMVMNELLGAGPLSRLRGGAAGRGRSSYSQLDLRRHGGLLIVGAAVRAESTGGAVSRLRSEMRRFVSSPPSDEEIAAEGRRMSRSFTLANDATSSQAAQWLSGALYGLGDDAVERHAADLAAVKGTEVRAAAARWLDADRAAIVVVGEAATIRPQLEGLGQVEVVPFDAPAVALRPAPAMDLTPPTPEALTRGRETAARAVAAHGGAARLQGIKDCTSESEVTLFSEDRTMSGTQREMRREPLQLRIEVNFMHGASVQALDGERGWTHLSVPTDSVIEADSLEVAALKALFHSDPVHLLLAAASADTRLAWRGEDEVATRPVEVVEMVKADGQRTVLFFDRETHVLVAAEDNDGSPLAGPVLRRVFGEPRAVGGIRVPHTEERLVNGQRTVTFRTTKVTFNTGLAAEAFQKPGKAGPRPKRR